MNFHYTLADDGKTPVLEPSLEKWAQWMEATQSRSVGYTVIENDEIVSTVFLGVNHQWGDGPPLLFETMIFGGERNSERWLYTTYDEARKGHEAAVEELMGSC